MPIPLSSLGPGPDPPKIIDVLIEIPKDSRIKYEVDSESGLLRVDRVLTVAHYIHAIMDLYLEL